MEKRRLTEEQAAQIYRDRFASGTPRSGVYQAGFMEKLRRLAFPGSPNSFCPHKAGTAEFDAWYAGLNAADDSVTCFWYRLEESEAVA